MSPSLRTLFRFHKPGLFQQIGLVVTIPFFLAALVWALRDFQFEALWHRLQTASVFWLAIAIACLPAGQLLRVVRWNRVLGRDAPPAFMPSASALMDGQIINWLSPIRLGDVWRVWRLTQSSERNVPWTLISIVLEKSADSLVLASFAVLIVAVPSLIQLPGTENGTISILLVRLVGVGLACLLLMGAGLALRPGSWLGRVQSRMPAAWLEKLAPDRLQFPPRASAQLQTAGFWLELVATTLAIWLLGIATNVALAACLNMPLSFGQHLMLLLALQVGLVLSTMPANIGIFPLVASGIFGLFGFGSDAGVVFGSFLFVLVNGVNCALWFVFALAARNVIRPGAQASSRPILINGVHVDGVTVRSLLARTDEAVRNREHLTILYANAHAVNLAQQDPPFKRALNAADLVFCDGFGVHWAARWLGRPLPQRLTPPDWIGELAAQCASQNTTMFLLGSHPRVAERAAQKLCAAAAPSLQVVCHDGFFDADGVDNDAVMDAINMSGARVLLVGMGMPRQELWIDRNRARLTNVNVCISVGALFDYLSGNVHRGPAWMTDGGLEWLARLVIEPARLWRRYLLGNPLFVWHVLRQKLGHTIHRAS